MVMGDAVFATPNPIVLLILPFSGQAMKSWGGEAQALPGNDSGCLTPSCKQSKTTDSAHSEGLVQDPLSFQLQKQF